MNLKQVGLLIAVIGVGVIASGCTGGQDVTPVFKALPEVQQFLNEHPNAKITVTYWSKEEMAQSEQEISKQCDKPLTPVAMYKAIVSEGDLKIVSWIDAENKTVICSTTEGKQTISTSTATPIQTAKATSAVTATATPLATATPAPTMNPQSQVHKTHVGPGTVGLQCDTCHGFPPVVPVQVKQNATGPGHYVICENCHAAPPDSMRPSGGNLIEIHLSRGSYCTICHDIAKITPAHPSSKAENGTVIKCENCHANPQNSVSHINGGKYCLNCHT